MILNKYLIRVGIMTILVLNSSFVLADSNKLDYKNSPNISMFAGKAENNAANYDGANYLAFEFSKPIYSSGLNLDIGWKRFTRFYYNSDEDNGVEVTAYSLGVSKEIFKRRRLSVDVGLNALSYNSKTYFLGSQVDSAYDFTLGAEIRSAINFRVVALNFGLEWYRDISNADISIASIGITFNLGPMFGF